VTQLLCGMYSITLTIAKYSDENIYCQTEWVSLQLCLFTFVIECKNIVVLEIDQIYVCCIKSKCRFDK